MSFQNQPTECDCGCDRRRREAIAGEARPTPVEPGAALLVNYSLGRTHGYEEGFREARRLATSDGLPLDVLARWWVDSHMSSRKGHEAGTKIAAFWEDWWDANMDEPWPLPRVARLASTPSEAKP